MRPSFLVPIHADGWKFVAGFAIVALGLMWLWPLLGWVGLLATLWCAYFFRDPPRVTPLRAGLVVAPADGAVVAVEPAAAPPELEMAGRDLVRIGIFLDIFDVHINRVPISGRVVARAYHRGQFLNASLDKASDLNERMAIRLAAASGEEVAVVQVAGLIARRILCWIVPGEAVETGQRFGLIRFGSRVDLYVPAAWSILAVVGQRAVGGETVLADMAGGEPARAGVVR